MQKQCLTSSTSKSSRNVQVGRKHKLLNQCENCFAEGLSQGSYRESKHRSAGCLALFQEAVTANEIKVVQNSPQNMEESEVTVNDSWIPPTETEMKVIQAKRERCDKVSKIMGQYLLKGYRMLNSSCDACQTVLLQSRQGELYCVACSEVDSEHTKDNPILNGIAARRQLQESDHRSSSDATTTEATAVLLSTSTVTNTESNLQATSAPNSKSKLTNDANSWISQTESVLRETMITATENLKGSKSVDYCIQYCTLIKVCADALASLKALKDNIMQ